MKHKRLLVLSDTHCGSVFGLTPHNMFAVEAANDLLVTRTADERKACWKWFESAIKEIRPIDRLVLNGDLIEGPATKQQSLELLAVDPQEQIRIAERVVEFVGCKDIAVIAGTAYHTGDGTDYERLVADKFGVKFGGHEYYDIDDVCFSFKHHIGGSQSPMGRSTPLVKELVWALQWSLTEEFPDADVVVRSHVHYHVAVANAVRNKLAMTTPALQTPGSRFGVRRMSGIVDYGFVYFDIYPDGTYSWQPVLWQGQETAWAQLPIDWS